MKKIKIEDKIIHEAYKTAQAYIKMIRINKNPAKLNDQISFSRNEIMEIMNDRRLNTTATLEKIRIQAKRMIVKELNSDLINKLCVLRSLNRFLHTDI